MPKLGAVQFLNFKKDRFDQEGKTFKEARGEHVKEAKFDFQPIPDPSLFHESGNPPPRSVR